VFENRVLMKIFGPKRDKVTGEWRRLHNEKLHDLYSSPNVMWVNKSRRIRWPGHVAQIGERRGGYSALVGKPLARPRHGWEDTIESDLQEIGWWDIDSIDVVQDGDRCQAVVNMIMELWVHKM
jgi:hypothetical protein